MKSKIKKRNGELDFWKFVFSLVIVLHHSYMIFDDNRLFFRFGSLAVEFFFIVSGYFFASSVMKKREPFNIDTIGRETSAFIFNKAYNFMFYYAFAVILRIIVNVIQDGPKAAILNHKFFTIIFDILFINAAGLNSIDIIESTWYISAMLIVMAILYPIIRKIPDLFINIISPITAILLYSFMMKSDGYLGDPDIWYLIVSKGILRAVAGLCLGCFCYKLSLTLKNNPIFNQPGKLIPNVLSVLDVLCIAGSVFEMQEMTKLNCEIQPVIVLAMAMGITICTSQKSSIAKKFNNKFCAYLGKLSLSIFFCHSTIIGCMNLIIDRSSYLTNLKSSVSGQYIYVSLLIVFSIILGIICIKICDPIKKKFENYITNIKIQSSNNNLSTLYIPISER